jgi:hypothetical protein
MSDAPNQNPEEKDPIIAFLWLLVGLAPIVILLITTSLFPPPYHTWGGVVILICVLCNLLGGIGCVRNIKDGALRLVLGIFLAVFFFLLSLAVVVFQACSHMNI